MFRALGRMVQAVVTTVMASVRRILVGQASSPIEVVMERAMTDAIRIFIAYLSRRTGDVRP